MPGTRDALRGVLRIIAGLVTGLVGPLMADEALAQAAPARVGMRVVVKDPQTPLQLNDQVSAVSARHHLYRVEKANGSWLFVADAGLAGWVQETDVVPLEQAIDYFTAVVRSHPLSSTAYYMRGLVWSDLKQPEIAGGDFTEAMKIDGKNAWAYFYRGNVRSGQRDWDGAVSDYTEAVRLDQTNSWAYHNRGIARDHLGQLDHAIADYSEAIRRDPHYPEAFLSRGGVFIQKHEYGRALADYDQALRDVPESAEAHQRRAWVLATARDSQVRNGKLAVEEASRANALSGGKDPYILATLAAAYAEAGNFDAALDWQKKANEALPADSADRESFLTRLLDYDRKEPVRD